MFEEKNEGMAQGPDLISLDRMDQRGITPDTKFRNTLSGVDPTFGASRSVVYIIDCGISLPATVTSQLSDAIIEGQFWSNFNSDYGDNCDHGTSMAVLVAGRDYGTAPGVRLRIMKATSNILGGYSGVLSALQYLHNNAATLEKGVISMSLGVRTSVPADVANLQAAVDNVVNDGFFVVAAAGNENKPITEVSGGITTQTIPAAFSNVVTVGGVQYQSGISDTRWFESSSLASNYGAEVDLFAPGKQFGLNAIGNSIALAGTSGATAYTSGVLATMFQLRPAATNTVRLNEFYSKASANTVNDNLSANHRGQLFSDIGARVLPSTLGVFQETRICPSKSFPTAAPKTSTAQASGGGAVYVAYTVDRWSGCLGVGPGAGPVDLVVEKYDAATGARSWRTILADPNTSNASLSDFIGGLSYQYNLNRLLVGVASGETGRFSSINTTISAGVGVDAYVLSLNAVDGSVVWVTRMGGPGTDVVKAVTQYLEPSSNAYRVVVAGTTTGSFPGAAAVQGGVDAFYWRGSADTGGALAPAVPILVDAVNGSQRLEDAVSAGIYPNPRIVVGGGTDSDISNGAWISPTATAELDAFIYELDVTSSPTATIVVNRQTFKPSSPITPFVQIDDWVTKLSSYYPSNTSEYRYVTTVSRQWDVVSGGNKAYLGNDSLALTQYAAGSSPTSPTWLRQFGPYTGNSWNGITKLAVTPEDAYLVVQNQVRKFAGATGLESFAESLTGAPTYAVYSDPYLWFGSSSATSQYLAR